MKGRGKAQIQSTPASAFLCAATPTEATDHQWLGRNLMLSTLLLRLCPLRSPKPKGPQRAPGKNPPRVLGSARPSPSPEVWLRLVPGSPDPLGELRKRLRLRSLLPSRRCPGGGERNRRSGAHLGGRTGADQDKRAEHSGVPGWMEGGPCTAPGCSSPTLTGTF